MIEIKENEFYDSFAEKGFKYDKDLLFNYFNALQTKPFVILTGISGSGKSKIAEIFAETLSPNGKKLFELIPVKPNWRDSKSLFGYHNLITDTYSATPLIKLFIKAINDKENPYFLILDEMNLAKTEHYFSDYLSLIESRRLNGQKDVTFALPDDFTYPYKITVSDAIILASLYINKPDEELTVEEYRNTILAQKWFEQFSTSKTPLSQFRTELNQKEGNGRLAQRVFDSSKDNSYKLKKLEDISNIKDKKRVIKMQTLLEEIVKKYKHKSKVIEQQNILLHNSNNCLSPNGQKCDENCTIASCDKYKCDKIYSNENGIKFIPPEIPIPLNVFTVGTVNVDETTYMFSPKVLDRANVIEFNNVDFKSIYGIEDSDGLLSNLKSFSDENFYFNSGNLLPKLEISIASSDDVKNFMSLAPEEFQDILKIFAILEKENMHFGYRVMNEISLYIKNVDSSTSFDSKHQIATDLQILQKILPKIHGTYEKIWSTLVSILSVCYKENMESIGILDESKLIEKLQKNQKAVEVNDLRLDSENLKKLFKYPRSASKILSMLTDLSSHGYASYIK